MLTSFALLASMAVASPTGSSASVTGFAEADAEAVTSRLRAEITACAGDVVDVELPSPCDEACVGQTAVAAGVSRVVTIEALRVGGDVDVQERIIASDSRVQHDGHRTVPAADFAAAVLSPEACAILRPAVEPVAPVVEAAPLHPAWFIAGAGAVIAAGGLVAFAVEATTLEDPKSSGADKERARVTGTIALGAVFVGVVAAGVGAGIALSE